MKMLTFLIEKLIVNLFAIFYGSLINFIVFLFHLKTGFKNLSAKDHSKRPAVLDDPNFHHHSITINKKAIHYVTHGNSDDPIIVFLHGFPDFWFSWRDQLIEFGKKSYFTVAIDLPGLGESQKILENGQLKITVVSDQIAQAIKAILSNNNQQIILIGHDFGACVSYIIASEHKQLVSKLVILNGPHPVHFRKFITSSLKQFLKSWYMLFFNSPFWPEFVFQTFDFFMLKGCFRKGDKTHLMNDEQLEPWKYIFSQPFAIKSALGYYRDFVKRGQFLEDLKLPVSQPTLIIWGDNDRALSLELATQVAQYVDNVQIKIVQDAGHFVHLEQPAKTTEHISNFISNN